MNKPSHNISIGEHVVITGEGLGVTGFSVVIDGIRGSVDVLPMIAGMYSIDRLRALIRELLTQTLEQAGLTSDFRLLLDSRASAAMEIFLARRAKATG